DDVYLPEFAARTRRAFEKKNCLITFTNYAEIKNDAPVKRTVNLRIKDFCLFWFRVFPKSRLFRRLVFAFGNFISCPAVSYDMQALCDFKFHQELKVALDWEAWHRIGRMKGRFAYIPAPLMHHRIHGESETSRTIKDNTRLNEELQILREHWPAPIARWLLRFYKGAHKTNE
ncbi:MAG: glycosyltransferase family 2 protein, partial [Clostridia bacterium]|nr:glycosyltransferase family 2 protein [Clostridia bacterium]